MVEYKLTPEQSQQALENAVAFLEGHGAPYKGSIVAHTSVSTVTKLYQVTPDILLFTSNAAVERIAEAEGKNAIGYVNPALECFGLPRGFDRSVDVGSLKILGLE